MNNSFSLQKARFNYDLNDTNEITRRIRLAARLAMLDHKCSGDPIIETKNGTLVRTEAEDIVVPDEEEILEGI
jgi:hypothetical protein